MRLILLAAVSLAFFGCETERQYIDRIVRENPTPRNPHWVDVRKAPAIKDGMTVAEVDAAMEAAAPPAHIDSVNGGSTSGTMVRTYIERFAINEYSPTTADAYLICTFRNGKLVDFDFVLPTPASLR